MPTYKDEKRGTWYCQFYYKDWKGNNCQKRKRGFSRERDAKQWERDFLNSLARSSDISFPNLVENYLADLATRLKPTTMETKEHIIRTKVLPYFKNKKAYEVDELSIRQWQNELITYRDDKGKPYSETYLKTIHNQLSAILNYAMAFYNLGKNAAKNAGSIGKSHADSMKIWTLDQFEYFLSYEKKEAGRLAFDVLFWTGLREGEFLALTANDFFQNGPNYFLNVDKNYAKAKGEKLILTPKTDSSKRCLAIPEFLYHEVMDYYNRLYGARPTDRLFYFTKSYLLSERLRVCKLADMAPIRIHDLRHSHASMLIELGWNILMVSQRLGHEKVETTWRTYAHLYPDKEQMLANQLNTVKTTGITANATLEEQIVTFMGQIQKQFESQPALTTSIDNEQIIRWDTQEKQKSIVTSTEFEEAAEINLDMESDLATLELINAGFLEVANAVYCLSSRGLPFQYL
ncbi:MAG: tyrosine-type recombinase/integrase [Lachnospiraceae bacterium]